MWTKRVLKGSLGSCIAMCVWYEHMCAYYTHNMHACVRTLQYFFHCPSLQYTACVIVVYSKLMDLWYINNPHCHRLFISLGLWRFSGLTCLRCREIISGTVVPSWLGWSHVLLVVYIYERNPDTILVYYLS